jgi:hypothetical protein
MIWFFNLEFGGCKFRVIVGRMYLHLELWFLTCILQLIYVSKLIMNFNSPLYLYSDLGPRLSKLFYFHLVLHSIENFNFCSTWPLCKFQLTLGLNPFSLFFKTSRWSWSFFPRMPIIIFTVTFLCLIQHVKVLKN